MGTPKFIIKLATLAGLVFALFMVGLVPNAGATPTVPEVPVCVPGVVNTYNTQVHNRPDSAVGGGTWAKDTFKRTTVVTNNCDGTYKLVLKDRGTFKTVAGTSPQNGVPLSGGVTGEFYGGATLVVTSQTAPHGPPVHNGGNVSSSEWPSLLFDVGYTGVMGDWGWTYKRFCERWVNAAGGNSGDITGKSCVPKQPVHKPGDKCKVDGQHGVYQMTRHGLKCICLPHSTTSSTPTSTTTTSTTAPTTTTTTATTTTTTPVPVDVSTTTSRTQLAVANRSDYDNLASTGPSVLAPLVVGGGLLVLIGGALLLLRRQRRSS